MCTVLLYCDCVSPQHRWLAFGHPPGRMLLLFVLSLGMAAAIGPVLREILRRRIGCSCCRQAKRLRVDTGLTYWSFLSRTAMKLKERSPDNDTRYVCFGAAMRTTSNPALINQLCYLSPFLSLFFISTILGEPILVTTYIGLLLIVGGLVYNKG